MATRPGPGYLPEQVPIDAYGAGGFRFHGMSHKGSLLALPGAMMAWTVVAPDDLTTAAFRPVVERSELPEILLIGLGAEISLLDPTIRFMLNGRGISVDAMASGAAARTYNILLAEGRSVGAALIAVE